MNLPTVQSYMADDGIGYIHIYSFSSHTAEEFRTQYEKPWEAGMDRLILDLRMNPGGLIDSVVAVADQILSGGPVVSYQEKNGNTQVFSIKGTDDPLPLVVLMDRNSASASEILAGAVQDKKAGTVMGERSYGKGTVQVIHPMDGREALKLSVAQYLTAAGRRIDKIGIEPDIPVTQTGRLFDPGPIRSCRKPFVFPEQTGSGEVKREALFEGFFAGIHGSGQKESTGEICIFFSFLINIRYNRKYNVYIRRCGV